LPPATSPAPLEATADSAALFAASEVSDKASLVGNLLSGCSNSALALARSASLTRLKSRVWR
jgi:hypothetical protein